MNISSYVLSGLIFVKVHCVYKLVKKGGQVSSTSLIMFLAVFFPPEPVLFLIQVNQNSSHQLKHSVQKWKTKSYIIKK